MAGTKKIKKSLESVNSGLLVIMKSGKYLLEYKQALNIIRQGKGKLRKPETKHYTMLAKTGVHHYSGNNTALGTMCKIYCRAHSLATLDPGDSGIIRSMPEQTGEK